MKKLLLTTVGLAVGLGAFAQLPVSQTAENRHAILEEFTGLYCTFCPDGHKVGNDIANANPTTYHRIHIHAGGFAQAQAGDPDMVTTEGTAIDNVGNPGGSYPFAGTNRGAGGSWGVGRGSWTGAANTILGQASHVNVAVEGTVNEATRQLTVDVEVFYTGTGSSGTEYLTVALLQSNILGHQTDGGNFFPQGWKCQAADVYKHAHVLRMLVNTGGTNGDAVSTTSGVVETKQYILTLPAQLNGVDLEIGELDLVAFITEGNNLTTPIVSGNDGPVNVVLGAGMSVADVSSTSNHIAPTGGLCDNVFTPKMDVTNNSGASITGIDVSYTINGGTPVSVSLPAQVIAAGATYSHSFSTANLSGGTNIINYDVTVTDATKWDGEAWNNSTCPDAITVLPSTSLGATYTWDFESSAIGEEGWNNAINTENSDFFVIDETAFTGIPNALGGYANSTKSFRHRLYNMAPGDENDFFTYQFDLSGVVAPSFEFDYAYAQFTANSNDGIKVSVSTNCGANWTQIFNKSGNSFTTSPATGGTNAYYPTPTQWKTEKIDLSPYKQNDVMFRISIVAGNGGNCLYLDNINVDESTVGIDDISNQAALSIFPNPTNEISTISFNLAQSASVSMEVYNSLGSLVFAENKNIMNAGTQNVTFNGSELPDGIYFVNLTIDDKVITKKISLIK